MFYRWECARGLSPPLPMIKTSPVIGNGISLVRRRVHTVIGMRRDGGHGPVDVGTRKHEQRSSHGIDTLDVRPPLYCIRPVQQYTLENAPYSMALGHRLYQVEKLASHTGPTRSLLYRL